MGEHRVQFFDSIGRSCTKLLTSFLELGASLRELFELEQSNRRETSPRTSASARPPTTMHMALCQQENLTKSHTSLPRPMGRVLSIFVEIPILLLYHR